MFNKKQTSKEPFEWNPYPQTKPPKTGEYLVSIKKMWQDWTVTDRRKVLEYTYGSEPWITLERYEKVVAWAYIPEPYQKEC